MRPIDDYQVFTARPNRPLRHNGSVRAADHQDAEVYADLMYDEWRWEQMLVVPTKALVRVIRPE